MTPLAARKKLLLMESDINRAHLLEGIHNWKETIHRSREHLTSLGSIASLAVKLAAAVPAISSLFKRRHHNPAHGFQGRSPSIFNAAVTGTSLLLLMRSFLKKS